MARAWSSNALEVLTARYLLRGPDGLVVEDPKEILPRVATAVARVESTAALRRRWRDRFLTLMEEGSFLPNSPTLMNAGKPRGQLSACFVLPVEDSLEEIFTSLKYAAQIHQSGGGTGFSFSRLRPQGASVGLSEGVASGPVSFLRIFDTATDTIKQGGARRGANMAILRVDHPDILEFIDVKRDQSRMTNFNLSVGVTDEFMAAVDRGLEFGLRDPRTQRVIRTVPAAEILARMAGAAWAVGDPGIVFLDRMSRFNPTPRLGEMESTNPCGEQPLLPFESCNLGSFDLGGFIKQGDFDWVGFGEGIATAVRFLDNVIDANDYPIAATGRITRRNRKVGLGVMGFADALLALGMPYDSLRAVAFGEKLMSFLDRRAREASASLALERGSFAGFRGSIWDRLGYPALRNATVSTVAPTGTLSLLAGCSSGIEPIFAGVTLRNVLDGRQLREAHPYLLQKARAKGLSPEGLSDLELLRFGGPAWRTASDISVEWHIRMQAAFQRHSDSAVSKTINLPNDATEAEVVASFRLAFELGCKGITVYRDRSRQSQVLVPGGDPARGMSGRMGTHSCPTC